jgi:hypothetical protein
LTERRNRRRLGILQSRSAKRPNPRSRIRAGSAGTPAGAPSAWPCEAKWGQGYLRVRKK